MNKTKKQSNYYNFCVSILFYYYRKIKQIFFLQILHDKTLNVSSKYSVLLPLFRIVFVYFFFLECSRSCSNAPNMLCPSVSVLANQWNWRQQYVELYEPEWSRQNLVPAKFPRTVTYFPDSLAGEGTLENGFEKINGRSIAQSQLRHIDNLKFVQQ